MTTSEERYGIMIQWEYGHEPPIKVPSIQDAVVHLNQWLQTYNKEDDGDDITPIVVNPKYSERKGWHIFLKPDKGFHCRCSARILTFLPFSVEQQEGWIRGSLPDQLSKRFEESHKMFEDWQAQKKDHTEEFAARAIGILSAVVMNLDTACLRFDSWPPDLPIQMLVEKMDCNHSPRIGFINSGMRRNKKINDRNIELCTKLLEQGNRAKTWKNLRFINISDYNAGQIQEMLEAVTCHTGLETLDLRAEKRIHTWAKNIRVTKDQRGNMKPEVCVFPLVQGLTSSMVSLQTLVLSGQRLTHDSAHALIGKLAGVRTLTKVMLRDTCLDGASMQAVASLLLNDNCGIRTLDISHNEEPFVDPAVMQELCNSLKANTTLQDLRLEHCMLKTPHYQILAESLPSMKGLQHLSLLEAYRNRTIPFCVTIEEFSAYLAKGPGIVVDALEGNHSLLALDLAEGVGPRACCVTPPYDFVLLDKERMGKLRDFLQRNNEAFDGKSWAEENIRKKWVDLPRMDRLFDRTWLVDWYWTRIKLEREQRTPETAPAQ